MRNKHTLLSSAFEASYVNLVKTTSQISFTGADNALSRDTRVVFAILRSHIKVCWTATAYVVQVRRHTSNDEDMSSMVPDDAPRPRLAHVTKSPDFVGYGFNLHAEKGKAGQFIGDVDAGSPAATAGLRSGDRIIEVNGTNIANENHQQVVQRVKAIANETKLLVVDAETDKYYREKKIVIRGDMPNVLRFPAAGDYDDGTSQPAG